MHPHLVKNFTIILNEKKEESIESFKNYMGISPDNLYEASNNNSKEELHYLHELLEFQSISYCYLDEII